MKNFWIIALLLFSLACNKYHSPQQEKVISDAIHSKQYVFIAQSAHPATGGRIQLTSEYDLAVSGDSLFVHLPYFGRAYNLPPGTDAGIKFSTSSFRHNITTPDNKSFSVVIVPENPVGVQEFSIYVSSQGNASLSVTLLNRQPIHFYGYITRKNTHGVQEFN